MMINTPTLPPKKGYVEVEIEGKRTYMAVGTGGADDNTVEINITGSGNSNYCYVTIDGTKYVSPTTIKVAKGTSFTAYAYSVFKDDLTIHSGSTKSATITANTSLDIKLTYSSSSNNKVAVKGVFDNCHVVTGFISAPNTTSMTITDAIGKKNIAVGLCSSNTTSNYTTDYNTVVALRVTDGNLALGRYISSSDYFYGITSATWDSSTGKLSSSYYFGDNRGLTEYFYVAW